MDGSSDKNNSYVWIYVGFKMGDIREFVEEYKIDRKIRAIR